MGAYIVRRLIGAAASLLAVSVLIFLLIRAVPGDVLDSVLGNNTGGWIATEDQLRVLREQFGLNDPLIVQYGRWLFAALGGDLGTSWRTGTPVGELLLQPLATSLQLALMTTLISIVIGIAGGAIAAIRRGTVLDHVVRLVSVGTLAMPVFWIGTMILLVLSLTFGWIPPVRYTPLWVDPARNLTIMVLPLITLGLSFSASIVRFTRSSLLEVLEKDYVTTAVSKGLPPRIVLNRHVLRNALIPVATAAGLQMGWLVGGLVVVEEVFAIPGLGRFLLTAVSQRDYPVVQTGVIVMAMVFILANLIVDMLYVYIDPHIRVHGA